MRRPLLLLAVIVLASLGARAAWLGDPCHAPCRTAADHTLVFDEVYYVNAARRIAGVSVPGAAHYAAAPAGEDPNSEHPQLVKLVIAGAIELFGDGPLAWRLGSLMAGTLALLGLYALARAAGGSERLALVATALMAADNLLLVHGRIATLDIYAVAAMVWGVAAYLRGRPLLAGVVLGVGACCKLVTPYALIALLLYETAGAWRTPRRADALRAAGARLAASAAVAALTFVAVLAVLDRLAPPYDPNAHRLVGGGVLGHIGHILAFAGRQVSASGPTGIASYPWAWWLDLKPIVYLNIDAARPAPGLMDIHPDVHFLGVVSPPILALALPALALAVWRSLRRRRWEPIDALSVAWCAGVWLPFALASLLLNRTSYLYYMVAVMPGVYLAVARLVTSLRAPPWAPAAWAAAVAVALVLMYPLTPLP